LYEFKIKAIIREQEIVGKKIIRKLQLINISYQKSSLNLLKSWSILAFLAMTSTSTPSMSEMS